METATSTKEQIDNAMHALGPSKSVTFCICKTNLLAFQGPEAGVEIFINELHRKHSKERVTRMLISRWRSLTAARSCQCTKKQYPPPHRPILCRLFMRCNRRRAPVATTRCVKAYAGMAEIRHDVRAGLSSARKAA
jgi:hypothetical protein